MKKKNKAVLISVLSVIFLICVGVIAWYVCIELFSPTKVTINRKNIDLQVLENGSDSKAVIEVNYRKNANKNGLEMFEVNYNSLGNEQKEYFSSIGFQYVANSALSKLNWQEYINSDYQEYSYERKELRSLWHKVYYTDRSTSFRITNGEEFLYTSTDDYYTPLNNTKIDVKEKLFRVQIGEELYLMKMIGADYTDANYVLNGGNYYDWESHAFLPDVYYFAYYSKDFAYLNQLLMQKVKGLASGTNHYYRFEFGDLFEFYKYDAEKESYIGEKVTGTNLTKLLAIAQTDIVIKISVSDDGVRSSNDSIFNSVRGNETFSISGEFITTDYFYGKTIAKLDATNFDFVLVHDNYYALKLNENTRKFLDSYKEIMVEVSIDMELFDSLNYEFFGFTDDCGLNNYKLFKIYKIRGETKEEIAYA